MFNAIDNTVDELNHKSARILARVLILAVLIGGSAFMITKALAFMAAVITNPTSAYILLMIAFVIMSIICTKQG